MHCYPYEMTKYGSMKRTYKAFGTDEYGYWAFSAGMFCGADASQIRSYIGTNLNYVPQNAYASRNLPYISKGTIEFSFSVVSVYNAGAMQVLGNFSVTLFDNIVINQDNVSIAQNGVRTTIIGGLGAQSYIGAPKNIYVKASQSSIVISVNGVTRSAQYLPLEGLNDNITFFSTTAAVPGRVNFASNSAIYAPNTIKLEI